MSDAQTNNESKTKPYGLLHPKRVIARVVIELTAPLSISTGEPGDDADNALVRDANGLPTLPGSSIAGVLRSLWDPANIPGEPKGEADRKGAAFGYQDRAEHADAKPEALRSRVRVSWGALHDRTDKPVDGLVLPDTINEDRVLKSALTPVVRDHVRLDCRGTVDGDGKFTRASVMVGHRFTFELETSGAHADTLMDELLALLSSPRIRFGGRTRAGLGAFKVVRGARQTFNLEDSADLKAWIARPLSLREPLEAGAPIDTASGAADVLTLKLTPTEPWQVGAGDGAGIDDALDMVQNARPDADHYTPDILPYTERRIVWPNGRGALSEPQLVLPASAIKGAIRHRTAFYLRLAAGDFARTRSDDPHWSAAALPGVRALFGEANESDKKGSGKRGQVGLVFIDDVRVPLKGLLSSTHVSLDRFTGAPLLGHLFTDISVDSGTPLAVNLHVDVHRRDARGAVAHGAVKALRRAIDDLCGEQLQLGAGAGRGYGYFAGTIEGSAPDWYTEAEA